MMIVSSLPPYRKKYCINKIKFKIIYRSVELTN